MSAVDAPAHVPHASRAERVQAGKAARKDVPRSSQGAYDSAGRPDPISLLEEQAKTRVPELVPIRYGRMLTSPFAFYRGAALIMASDLARSPVSGLQVQCCGDAHLLNFGVFASPERRLLFDVNDFDETLPGPWEWDLKRLVASMMIAAQDREFSRKVQERIVRSTVIQYAQSIAEFAGMGNLAVWYSRLDAEDMMRELSPLLTKKMEKRTEATLAKARTRDSMSALSKLTHVVDGEPRIVSEPPLIVPLAELTGGEAERGETFDALGVLMRQYRSSLEYDRRRLLEQFRLVDFARKVVGVGSVGTRAWIALLVGVDSGDPLFLQLKEADASVLERFVGRSEFANHGARVVAGQRMMQAVSDIFLGYLHVPAGADGQPRDFYGRQLRDWKGSFDPENAVAEGVEIYGRICGWTLARGHARSGDRVALAAYIGRGETLADAMVEFSTAYAEQNQADFAALQSAAKEGRIEVRSGL